MVLLEIMDGHAGGSCTRFLCELPIKSTVRCTIEHVAVLRTLRATLEAAVLRRSSGPNDGDGQHTAALTDAMQLVSSSSVQQKLVLTEERLMAGLAALEAPSSPPPSSSSLEACWLSFASRQLTPEKLLSDYVGHNEKSKVKLAFTMPTTQTPTPMVGGATGTTELRSTPSVPKRAEAAAAVAVECVATDPPAQRQRVGDHAGGPSSVAATQQKPQEELGVSLSAFWKSREGGATPAEAAPAEQWALDEDAPILSASQSAALSGSSEMRAALRVPRLQEALRHIDSAGTREAALARLELALENDPDFEAFSLQALRTIGWKEAAE